MILHSLIGVLLDPHHSHFQGIVPSFFSQMHFSSLLPSEMLEQCELFESVGEGRRLGRPSARLAREIPNRSRKPNHAVMPEPTTITHKQCLSYGGQKHVEMAAGSVLLLSSLRKVHAQ
ncbi:hypothetical protein BLNAU_6826 [Blattamonas nauphoetae]|uniref:Uncharacterized protein n=1 Tax=Blattamonas nauphoetae TaxID=2049346 RepID=A0ABQ9Y309_9EUKA|nr:hypothetical protein BLNAU_6826 [Blattamonas nauphoetae]